MSVAHQRESGILTGAGGLEPKPGISIGAESVPKTGYLPEPAPRAGFGNRLFEGPDACEYPILQKSGTYTVTILNLESGRRGTTGTAQA